MTELVYRPASLDDAALAADIMTAAYPAFSSDPVVTRYRWAHPRKGWSSGRFIVERGSASIAYLDWLHGPPEQDAERHCEVGVALDKAHLGTELLTTLWAWVSDHAEAGGSRVLEGYAAEDEPEMLDALQRVGYERDRFEKVWELDLKAHGDRLRSEAREAHARAIGEGFELITVADWHAPGKFEALHALDTRTRQDVPTTFPVLPEAFENFMERLSSPDRPQDRWWAVVKGGEPIAISYLRFPPVRGSVWTGYTCCHPDWRGRGLARAVKLQSLAQAADLGIQYVYTDNDAENAPMLHINERLGYQPRPGLVALVKRVNRDRGA